MRYRYEIDAQKAVRVWDDENPNENGAPFFYQPDRPNGQPWLDRAEAQAWVEAFIAELVAADLVRSAQS
jgi:hypothetical protein